MNAVGFMIGLGTALVAGLVPLYALAYLVYFILGLPLRRQERARLFLDLVATGLADGRSIEHTIISISQSHDRSVGVRFHLLAAYLQSKWNLGQALEKIGGFLPPQVTAMLRVGEEIGDPGRVLPACRMLLRDATSHVQSAYNYLVVLAFVLIPVIPAVYWALATFVIPKYRVLFTDLLEGQPLPWFPFEAAAVFAQFQILLALVFYAGAVFYIGGPRLLAWLAAGLNLPALDGVLYWVPWRRKRMQRDFAAMLAVLLDAQVPEDRAVTLAAATTRNSIFIRRAHRVSDQLHAGVKLTDALATFDATGEFRWRLLNALHSGKDFAAALEGWLENLDARAFRQQQVFAQLVTTGLVLYNGVMVGALAVFIFHGLTAVIEEGVLW
jgi:type II secretory pathway component PulF